jgi:hypothetical protein
VSKNHGAAFDTRDLVAASNVLAGHTTVAGCDPSPQDASLLDWVPQVTLAPKT